ncbi:MAG: SAM-dependent chlorinase/fluorinase [Anaerolineae bacterium]|nr:SAM-dependent chlorinase/fluorinase [Anaerolineae bacterium]
MPSIALLTDFGTQDAYVGVMKGVMAGICPDARFIDLTHAVDPQQVRQGAFILMTAYAYFPKGTVFLLVVDPGVGSQRRAIAARAGDYYFVAPDNGVLSYVLRRYPYAVVNELTSASHQLAHVSSTFHGRDVFAPAAAYLAAGESLDRLGKRVRDLQTLPQPVLTLQADRLTGEVLHIDHYGNIVTSLGTLTWDDDDALVLAPAFGNARTPARFSASAVCCIGGVQIDGVSRTYAQVGQGDLVTVIGSSGFLEISVNHGSAAERLSVRLGDAVELQIG